jgi:lysophospholipase L1-like esterase
VIPGLSLRSVTLLMCMLPIVGALSSCSGPTAPSPPPPPPELQISCPQAMEVESVAGTPLSVNFSQPTVSGGRQPVSVTCTPASGSGFPVGTTAVQCSAQDSSGMSKACSFSVLVRGTPRLKHAAFMAFGDSLTAGTTAPSASMLVNNPQSYPFKLQDLLKARYRDQTITVANAGEPGETAVQGTRRFDSTLLVVRPTVTLLMEGANDLFFFRDDAINRAIPALHEIVRQAQARGVLVMLATLPPQRPGGARDTVSKLIPAFNEAIRGVARDRGATLVDVEPVFLQDMSLIGNDDLHMTERGYDKMAEIFFEAIRGTFEESGQAPLKMQLRAAPSATFPFQVPAGSRSRR